MSRYNTNTMNGRYLVLLVGLLSASINSSPTPVDRHSIREASRESWSRNSLIGQGPRQEHSVVGLGTNVYIMGGVHYDSQSQIETINEVEFFDTVSDQWHIAAPLPIPMNHGNAASLDGKIYVLGSLSGGREWQAQPGTFVYEPLNDTWTNLTSMPSDIARGSSAVGVYGSKIFLAGGMTLLQAYEGGHQNSNAMVSSYDTATDTWETDYPPLPEPRQHVGFSTVGSIFYVIAGRENGIYQCSNTLFSLDMKNPTHWASLAPMPTARGSLSCAPIAHKIYCFGGEGNRDSPYQIFNETQVYDTRTDSWETLEPMEVPRHGTGAAAVGNAIYIPGGGVTAAFYPSGINDKFVPNLEEQ